MTAIVESIDISRSPQNVFSYATDFSRFADWQGGVVASRLEADAPLAVGSRARITRKLGPREMTRTEEVTELNPPRSWTVRSAEGLLTAIAKGSVEPLDHGKRSRLKIALEFQGHGIGRLLVPLVIRRQARKQLPKNTARLKELLERQA
jgi:uncharacterized protein YndB with AHSA1/START domain